VMCMRGCMGWESGATQVVEGFAGSGMDGVAWLFTRVQPEIGLAAFVAMEKIIGFSNKTQ